MLAYQCLNERQMGWCFKNIGSLIDDFENLDKTDPYDNGLSISDINCVEIADKSENEIILELRSKTSDINRYGWTIESSGEMNCTTSLVSNMISFS